MEVVCDRARLQMHSVRYITYREDFSPWRILVKLLIAEIYRNRETFDVWNLMLTANGSPSVVEFNLKTSQRYSGLKQGDGDSKDGNRSEESPLVTLESRQHRMEYHDTALSSPDTQAHLHTSRKQSRSSVCQIPIMMKLPMAARTMSAA